MADKQDLIKKDKAHWFHPLGYPAEAPHFIFTKGEGAYLWDIDGNKYLDMSNEKNLNMMQMEFRRSHVQRMTDGVCTAETGLIFIDMVDNIEKIGDHLTNIAQAIIGGLQWEGVKPKVVDVS